MPYAKGARRKKWMPKSTKSRSSNNLNKTNKDFRFKSANPYGIKPEPFPRVLYTRCKYATWDTLSTGVLGLADFSTYRTNSIYDPDYTGGGTTVVGHSQLNALYSNYQVLGAKILLTFSNPTVDGIRVGVRVRIGDAGSVSGQGLTQLLE